MFLLVATTSHMASLVTELILILDKVSFHTTMEIIPNWEVSDQVLKVRFGFITRFVVCEVFTVDQFTLNTNLR